MTDFRNKVVWITGASSGIGEALAKRLALAGARLVLSARRESELGALKKSLQLDDSHCMVLPLDLTHETAFENAAAEVFRHFGKIDVMIHNGGISQRGRAVDTAMAVDRRIMEVNFFGAVGLTKEVLPYMLKQRAGKFIVISSLSGKIGTKQRSAYCASKHALHGYFDSLRYDHWQDGISVLMVCPGFIKTEISLHALRDDGGENARMDDNQAKGMSPEICAEKIFNAALTDKEEILIGGKEILVVYLKRFLPSLLSLIMKRMKVQE